MIRKISDKFNNFKKPRTMFFYIIAAVVFLAALWTGSAVGDMFGMAPGTGKQMMITIPEGAGTKTISGILKDEGIIRHPVLFRVCEKLSGEHLFQQGGHLIGKGQSYKNIIKKLSQKPEVGVDKTVMVTIPEGFEARHIAEKLESMGLADKKEFLRLLDEGEFDFAFIDKISRNENRLEGYLFPATYELLVGESEYSIITKMLKAFEDRIVPIYEKSGTKYSLDEIVTMASLIEREAANDKERGKVASVFYNRLDIGMTLGSCATVQYIIKERKDVLSNSDIKIKSPYNTYINRGLPVGPIASAGEMSFMAALYPEDTDYLYFAAKADGSENVFTRTNEEHLNAVRVLQR